MSKIQSNIDDVSDKIDQSIDTFIEGIEKSEKGIFNKLLAIVKEVELGRDESIKQTVRNLRLLNRIRRTVENEILTDSYKNRVERFANQYPAIASLNNGYFKVISGAFDPNRELYKEVVKNSINLTRTSLLESGVRESVINPIINIVNDSVTTGSFYADMVKELEINILGDEERLGGLMRYSKQITTDAINQFNASYNETIATDLGLEWYYYSGGRRSTSRKFCIQRAGKYYHKKEVESWANDKWQGKAKGTTESSIFKYRGGYNCRHIFKPTMIDGVPQKYVKRAIDKGYYKDDALEKELNKPIEFVPAKTIQEAEERMKLNGIKNVSLKGLKSEQFNAALEVIETENNIKPLALNSFRVYKRSNQRAAAMYSPSNNELAINASHATKDQYYNIKTYKEQITDIDKQIKFYKDNYLGNVKYDQKKVRSAINKFESKKGHLEFKDKQGEKPKYFTVTTSLKDKSDQFKSTVYHEIGHKRYYKDLNEKVYFNFDKKRSVSEYGQTNKQEYFAEWYAHYRMIGEAGVPDDLLKYFKEIK